MNGRIYDPTLGRMLQADPFVPDLFNSQSTNRYSYAFNNPLSNTDPSGFMPDDRFQIFSIWHKVRYRSGSLSGDFKSGKGPGYAPEVLLTQTPGVLSNAIANQPTLKNKEQFVKTDVVEATLGGSATDVTDRKFANGADTNSFSEVTDSTMEGLPEILKDKQFFREFEIALKDAVGSAATQNEELGVVIYPDETGSGFNRGGLPNNIPNTAVLEGYKTDAFGIQDIENASAVVIGIPKFEPNSRIRDNDNFFNDLSNHLDAPVFVKGQRTDVFVYDGRGEPIKYNPRSP